MVRARMRGKMSEGKRNGGREERGRGKGEGGGRNEKNEERKRMMEEKRGGR